jgi:hypothetical protein
MGWLVKAKSQSFCPYKRNMVPIPQEAGWAPRPAWTCAKKFSPMWIWLQDRPGASESLHQSSAEVKNGGSQTSTSLYVFVTCM